ncbi:unnamed protein product [Closterium sp. Naga37s-1]|nr:unnamed protein product [Closterium sp. Naga37s-1]
MILWPLLSASPLVPSPVPSACPLWPHVPALLPAPRFRPRSCPLGGSLRTRSASPTILPALLSVPTAAPAARAPPAPPTCPSRAAAASLVMVTTCPGVPAKCAAGAVPVIAAPRRASPSARDVQQASGTNYCLSALSAPSLLASAWCCCAPLAADRAASATQSAACRPPPWGPSRSRAPDSRASDLAAAASLVSA